MAKRSASTRVRLSRETIVASAVVLADAEGLEAVTIRRLAQEHGVTPMAMYWHFSDKDSLLDGLSEYLIASVEWPGSGDAPWDEQLHGILEAFLVALRPHPALAALALRRILVAEPGLRIAERVLDLLRQAGFATERAVEIGTFLLCSVITLVASDPTPAFPAGEDHAAMKRQKTAALGALPPETYPLVVAAAPALVNCRAQDGYFALNLDLLVQGVLGLSRG
jgi:TetR/AcrR family tetracycline transcriptional repressor